eukprot:scaffold7964_cov17-Prasinocladus_malaysianus.AAC.1
MAQERTSSGAPAGSAAPDRRVAEPGGKARSPASLRLRKKEQLQEHPARSAKQKTTPTLRNRGTDGHRIERNEIN